MPCRLAYEQYGVPFPAPGTPPPPTITFQRKSANRRVLNEGEVLSMLREFGEVGHWPRCLHACQRRTCCLGLGKACLWGHSRAAHANDWPMRACSPPLLRTLHYTAVACPAQVRVVEFGGGAHFREQLAAIAGTGLFVSVHTSALANTVFLPPGAAVLEIIQRNWAWVRGGCRAGGLGGLGLSPAKEPW